MGKYVIKFEDAPDMLVELHEYQFIDFNGAVLMAEQLSESGGDCAGDGVLWAYAPGQWKSVHRLSAGERGEG